MLVALLAAGTRAFLVEMAHHDVGRLRDAQPRQNQVGVRRHLLVRQRGQFFRVVRNREVKSVLGDALPAILESGELQRDILGVDACDIAADEGGSFLRSRVSFKVGNRGRLAFSFAAFFLLVQRVCQRRPDRSGDAMCFNNYRPALPPATNARPRRRLAFRATMSLGRFRGRSPNLAFAARAGRVPAAPTRGRG